MRTRVQVPEPIGMRGCVAPVISVLRRERQRSSDGASCLARASQMGSTEGLFFNAQCRDQLKKNVNISFGTLYAHMHMCICIHMQQHTNHTRACASAYTCNNNNNTHTNLSKCHLGRLRTWVNE